jgi:hypothetical protein
MTDKPMFSIVREVSRHAGAAVAEGLFEGRRAAIKKFSSHQGFRRESEALSVTADSRCARPAAAVGRVVQ